jgi:uncharacterized protein YndB with AHSA1/START domain/ketosteroid isomerase-like protein
VIAAAHSIRVSRIIRADREALFRAWTDPEALMHWWRQEADGWAFAGASIDLRVGGGYRLGMTAPDGKTHVAVGLYGEVERPARLVFTWDWEEPTSRVGDTLVTVEFKEAGDHRTEVVVTHERFADGARMGRHEQGWTELLRLLERFVGSHRQLPKERNDMTTRETIQGYFNALTEKKHWESFLSDDMTFTSFTSPTKRVSGRAAFLESTKRFYSMITALEVRRLIVDDDYACALTKYALKPPAGPAFDSDVAEVFEVRDGKITSFDIYFDTAPFPK